MFEIHDTESEIEIHRSEPRGVVVVLGESSMLRLKDAIRRCRRATKQEQRSGVRGLSQLAPGQDARHPERAGRVGTKGSVTRRDGLFAEMTSPDA
jgi:hypothetical protein